MRDLAQQPWQIDRLAVATPLVPIDRELSQEPGGAARDVNPLSAGYRRKVQLWQKLPLPVANLSPRDAAHPARNQQLLIRSGGSDMNAFLFLAQGPGA